MEPDSLSRRQWAALPEKAKKFIFESRSFCRNDEISARRPRGAVKLMNRGPRERGVVCNVQIKNQITASHLRPPLRAFPKTPRRASKRSLPLAPREFRAKRITVEFAGGKCVFIRRIIFPASHCPRSPALSGLPFVSAIEETSRRPRGARLVGSSRGDVPRLIRPWLIGLSPGGKQPRFFPRQRASQDSVHSRGSRPYLSGLYRGER